MLYNLNTINDIAEIIKENLKSEIEEITFDIYFAKIVYDNGVSINIHCKDNKINKINIFTKNSKYTIVFSNDILCKNVSPFFIDLTSELKCDSKLFYNDRREIRFNDPKYQYFGFINSQY